MHQLLTRRNVIIAGAAFAIGGCSRRGSGGLSARPEMPPVPALATSTSAPSARIPGIWYRVERGDTLSSIARRSGLEVADIAERNKLRSTLITPGQRLWLPSVSRLQTDPLADRQSPLAADGDYRLVARSSWAAAGVGSNHRAMGRVTRLTLHHTGDHAGFRGKSDVEIVQMIDRYHREGRHWSAIGYHYLVGRDGRVYEGRPVSMQGAHVSGNNPHNVGISCIGDFQRSLPPRRQLATLAAFLGDQRRRYGVPRGRIYAHRDLGETVCPGERLYGWFKDFRQRV